MQPYLAYYDVTNCAIMKNVVEHPIWKEYRAFNFRVESMQLELIVMADDPIGLYYENVWVTLPDSNVERRITKFAEQTVNDITIEEICFDFVDNMVKEGRYEVGKVEVTQYFDFNISTDSDAYTMMVQCFSATQDGHETFYFAILFEPMLQSIKEPSMDYLNYAMQLLHKIDPVSMPKMNPLAIMPQYTVYNGLLTISPDVDSEDGVDPNNGIITTMIVDDATQCDGGVLNFPRLYKILSKHFPLVVATDVDVSRESKLTESASIIIPELWEEYAIEDEPLDSFRMEDLTLEGEYEYNESNCYVSTIRQDLEGNELLFHAVGMDLLDKSAEMTVLEAVQAMHSCISAMVGIIHPGQVDVNWIREVSNLPQPVIVTPLGRIDLSKVSPLIALTVLPAAFVLASHLFTDDEETGNGQPGSSEHDWVYAELDAALSVVFPKKTKH